MPPKAAWPFVFGTPTGRTGSRQPSELYFPYLARSCDPVDFSTDAKIGFLPILLSDNMKKTKSRAAA
jgi:hypothetical protein